MSTNQKTVEGIYRDGKVELLEIPADVEEGRVLVTLLGASSVSLPEHGIEETQAANLRMRLSSLNTGLQQTIRGHDYEQYVARRSPESREATTRFSRGTTSAYFNGLRDHDG